MTILGKHTGHELAELLTNLDGFVSSMASAFDAGWSKWSDADPAAADDWKRDWDSFRARWTPARAKGHAAVGSTLTWDVLTVEPDYQAVLAAFKPSDGDPTSFDDLDRRWRVQQAAPAPSYTTVQPTAPDADLGAYKTADQGVKVVQQVAAQAKAALPNWYDPRVLAAAGVALVLLIVAVRR